MFSLPVYIMNSLGDVEDTYIINISMTCKNHFAKKSTSRNLPSFACS